MTTNEPGTPGPPERDRAVTAVIVVAVSIGALGVLAVVALAALTLLGRSADSELTPVDQVLPAADEAAPPVDEPDPAFEPIDVPEPTDPYAPGLHPFCPDPGGVARATGQSDMEVGSPQHATVTFDLNDVALTAEVCEYGSTTSVARFTDTGGADVLARLRASDGRFSVWEGDLDVPSVRVVLPSSDPAGGSVREVFVVDGEVLSVARNGQDHDGVDALVEAVRAHG